jgi:type I restriction enzyme S subunit
MGICFSCKQSADNTQEIGTKNLVLRLINMFQISLPPYAEQHRIVAKVVELMAICDELETRLTTTSTTRRQLLESTLKEALFPQDQPQKTT